MDKFQKVAIMAILLLAFAAAVSAAPLIIGEVNLGSPVANIKVPTLNSAVFVGVPSFTVITPATGSFVTALGMGGSATSFVGNASVPGLLSFDGFTIDVTAFMGGPNVWTKVQLGTTDIVGFSFLGMAHKLGFADTPVIGSLTAQYSGGYNPSKVVAWSANISAAPVPEPGTYALMGLGLAGFAFLRRRK